MKFCIMQQFIKVSTVCYLKLRQKQSLEKDTQFYLEIIGCDLLIYTMDHSKFNVSNQRE